MEKKKSVNKKVVAEIILIVALIIFVISVLINTSNPEEIWKAIQGARYRYFFAAIGFLILYMILYSLSLIVLTRASDIKEVKIKDLFLISSCEFFFNGITPGAVGGQPFQVFAFNQVGVPASKSTGIILTNFLCAMIAQIIMALISLAYYPLLTQYAPNMIGIFWLGFVINCVGIVFFVCLGASKTFRKIMVKLMNWFCTWKIMRKAKGLDKKFEQYMENAQRAFAECWKAKGAFIVALVTKLLSYVALYMIPFFVLKALKLPVGHERGMVDASMFFQIICVTSFAILAANYIPTPGAAGFMEFTFMYFFLPMVIQSGDTATELERSTASAGVLLWRVVTYYLLMILSFICYFIFTKKRHIKYVPEEEKQEMVYEAWEKQAESATTIDAAPPVETLEETDKPEEENIEDTSGKIEIKQDENITDEKVIDNKNED